MKRGKFIVIEGCEGSGKSTVIERLKEKYPDALFTREIGGTEFAEKGPRYLVLTSPFSKDLNGYEQVTQAFSGRSHHLRKVVEPALTEGRNVFCDRFDASSWAYQIFGMECHHLFGLFDSLRASLVPQIVPDLYIILDISPEEGMKRVAARKAETGVTNYFDERGADLHARVRDGYRRFAEKNADRVKVIDAHPSKEAVWESVEKVLDPLFG
ncbi:dTMP kinase [Candidatus Parcubacteria bacterium]|nr:dTMP kinase [Candidatus Parcubacteria bacterium]